jgi:hypothetical protein
MGRIRGKKPSPAMLVSIVALVFAVAGTAVAGVATISVLNKKEKKQTRNIANKQIDKRASGLNVNSAKTAAHATNADQASSATAAGNASLLEGLGAGAFARATQIDSGSGDNTALTQTPLVSFPEIGLEVRTDGDADSSNALRLVNSRATGTFHYWTTGNPNAVGTLPPTNLEVSGGGGLNHDVVLALQSTPPAFEPSPVVSITCRFSVPPTVACIGFRSL